MAEQKTLSSGASVAAHIAERATPAQAEDCRHLIELLQRLTGQPPEMWGPSIVGFGRYRYTYASGRSGESLRAGFAIRGRELVLYVMGSEEPNHALLPRLGKHRMGKSCLYVKKLADLDLAVLEQILRDSLTELERRYGEVSNRLDEMARPAQSSRTPD